jgi:hypothetical protein
MTGEACNLSTHLEWTTAHMAIDHVIDLDCVPKQTLSTAGLLARMKARDRAETIINLYRTNGDMRPPTEMGFEMVRRLPDGTEEAQVIVVQDMLNEAGPLDDLAVHCENCPANRLQKPFGCFDYINYPISRAAELWLLKRLPTPEEPLVFLLLRQTLEDFSFDVQTVAQMRSRPGVFFESGERFARRYEDMQITTDQIFAMLFLTGTIEPRHAIALMLFFGAIPRDLDAEGLMALTAEPNPAVPFTMMPEDDDDETILAMISYFEALYVAYQLNVSLSLDV